MAARSMIGFKKSRLASESIFESFRMVFSNSSGKITAAAVTGPARQPRPASSVPHSRGFKEKESLSFNLKKFQQIYNNKVTSRA